MFYDIVDAGNPRLWNISKSKPFGYLYSDPFEAGTISTTWNQTELYIILQMFSLCFLRTFLVTMLTEPH